MSRLDRDRLEKITMRLGEAVIDPSAWVSLMEEICQAVSASGAALLQSDVRTPDIPRTAAADELFERYFAESWHLRDIRAERGAPRLQSGDKVVIDQDIVQPDEISRLAFYQECLRSNGFLWFAGIGFSSGSALWALTIQRAVKEGPFSGGDKELLAPLSQRLTETATLSKALGYSVLAGMTDALNLVGRPAVALDRLGFALDANTAAEALFNEEISIKSRRLVVRDRGARGALETFVDHLRLAPYWADLATSPIVVRREDRPPVIIRVLPIQGPASGPFLGARALLILDDLAAKPRPKLQILKATFGLTPAETRLASLIARGISPEQAAEELRRSRETIRNQLKSIFAKTDTHRQAELVSLLSQL